MANGSLWFGTLIVTLYLCESYKILVVFPMPARSHSILGDGIVRHLLNAGHEVTYITPFPKKAGNPKLHELDTSNVVDTYKIDAINLLNILEKNVDPGDMGNFSVMLSYLTRETVKNPNVQKILNDPKQNFDVAIVEWMFGESIAGYSAIFGCPFIWVSSMEPHDMILSLIDEATNPAYVPTIMSNDIPPFSFLQRAEQLWSQTFMTVIRYFVMRPVENQLYDELFSPIIAKRGRSVIPLSELKYQASLMLGNSHVSLGQATSLPQSYKPVGGYHIDTDVKPLPGDLKKIMDNAKNGVIYFSMGSNLKSKDMPEVLKNSILKMFGELPYTVLWKFEEVLPNLPKNVHILQWAPQQSILAHPNCKLFITHGGLLSTTETVHFGVPIIGIPVFGDQYINVDRSVSRGFARKVELSYQMADDMKVVIAEMMSNQKYREKVKELSLIYHDRPVHPGKELVHWVEHVVKTKGAPHLRSPALLLPWYQKMYLDLVALILVVMIIFVKLIKVAFSKCFGKKEKKQKAKKQ